MASATFTVLAFDFGERRIGIAVGNTLTKTSQPLNIIENNQQGERFAAIQAIIQEWRPDQLVVGLPVAWVDERYSSVDVDQGHDALAAQVILDQYFSDLKTD